MSKEIDYAKIVKKLNKELEAKYNSREFRNVYEEFGRKENQIYFELLRDSYNGYLIEFLGTTIYSSSIDGDGQHDKDEIVNTTKEWFNNYIDTLNKLGILFVTHPAVTMEKFDKITDEAGLVR
jgi:hypothetical protein